MPKSNEDQIPEINDKPETRLTDLSIVKGARHCRIVNEAGEIVFRTTNLRDAQAYLDLVEENRRLMFLMDARGIAPHRIYLLETGDLVDDVVIVAKAGSDSVVVRSLRDGQEQIVELDDLKQLPEADYFIGTDRPAEIVHVSVRVDRESDAAVIITHRNPDEARGLRDQWRKAGSEAEIDTVVPPFWSDKDTVVFGDEVIIQE